MSKELIVSSSCLETKVAIVEDDLVSEIYIERSQSKGILGNIYKGRVTRVLPGMQSAFVDIGLERDAFLYVSDFFEDTDEFEKLDTGTEEASATQPAASQAGERPGRRGKGRWDRERPARVAAGPSPVEEPPASEEDAAANVMEPIPSEAEFPTDSEVRAALEQWFAESQEDHEPDVPPVVAAVEEAVEEAEEETPIVGIPPAAAFDSAPETPEPLPQELPEPLPRDRALEPWQASPRRAAKPVNAPPAIIESEEPASAETPEPAEESSVLSSTPAEVPDVEAMEAEEMDTENADSEAALRNRKGTPEFNQHRKPGGRRRSSLRRRSSSSRSDNGQKPAQRQTISELLREGQEIMVQVAKEPIARKGARLTSYVALPGRFLVYMPTVEHIGVSRKIESDTERLRLRRLVNELRGSRIPGGFIVRTAGENHPDKEIEADVQYLSNLWEEIRANYEKASAPALVHSELGLVERIIRDHLSEDFKTIRVDDELEYERILDFVNRYQGSLVSRIKLFTKNIDIFDEFGVNAEIRRALEPKIWLKSGGYIVINQTEALVAIDVNTGKFVGKGDSLEETITKTNLEAVKEVVRQVRLRDLGGIIVIDFIDMEERKNRHRVMDALQQEITKDKAPSKVLEFNEFGLVAITRKRVKQSLEKVLCQACPYCGGSGMVKSITTVCYQIHGEIQKMAPNLEGEDVAIRVHPEVAKALRNGESKVLSEIETLVGHEINIKQDETLHISHFDIII